MLTLHSLPVKGTDGGVESGVGGVGTVGLKRKATSSDLGVAFEEEDALADLEPFDWSSVHVLKSLRFLVALVALL